MCPVGEYVRGIVANGKVVCGVLAMPNVSRFVDGPGEPRVGFDTAIATGADGLALIAYRNTTLFGLRVLHCGNPSCTAGNVITDADDPAGIGAGSSPSVAIGLDGLPIIAHSATNGLRVTHCGNVTCSAGNVTTTADGPAGRSVGLSSSIAIGNDGLPVIAHRDVTAGALRVTHCLNVACTVADVNTAADDPVNVVGISPSLKIGFDGLPIISHSDSTALVLRVTHCGNATCTAGSVHTTVDAPGERVGEGSAMLIGRDGLPVISHVTVVAGGVRLTTCGSRTCQ